MAEVWRPVPGWGHLYWVSSKGRVWSRRRNRTLIGSSHPAGYSQFRFVDEDGRSEWFRLHRLVALVFIGTPTGPLVRHLDDDPTNNAVENLAYGDHHDNLMDCARLGTLCGRRNVTHCKHGHEFTDANTYWSVRKNGQRRRHCRACAHERYLQSKAAA